MRFRARTVLVAVAVTLAGCGGSEGSEATGETEGASSTTAAASSTTSAEPAPEPSTTTTSTTSAPTTSAPTTTTTTSAPDESADGVKVTARDLRLVALSPADLGEGYQESFVNIAPQGGLPVPTPCGQEFPVETPFQAASNWLYPVDELGWPPNGVVYDVLMIAHQVALNTDDVVAEVADIAAGCDGTGEVLAWSRGGDSVEVSSRSLSVPDVRGVRGTGYLLTSDVDINAYLEYVLASEDVVVTLFLIGAAPSADDLPALAEPIVTRLQDLIADCFETPACADANG